MKDYDALDRQLIADLVRKVPRKELIAFSDLVARRSFVGFNLAMREQMEQLFPWLTNADAPITASGLLDGVRALYDLTAPPEPGDFALAELMRRRRESIQ